MPLLATSRLFSDGPMALESGGTLPRLDMAYETWGELAPDAGNAVLICHGYTSNPHAALWWPGLLGPGKAIDTARWFVVCANMLGSAYGSSGPPSIDPRSGRAYGPDFPDITLADMATAQERLLAHLGVRRLAAVIGYSFGGQLTLQWAASRPERIGAAVVVASGLRSSSGPEAVCALKQRFAACAGWNGGHYLDGGDGERNVRESLRALRLDTLRRYGVERHAIDHLGDSDYGHFAPTANWRDWGGALGEFLATHA